MTVLLLADPAVAATPLADCGAPLIDLRQEQHLLLDNRRQDTAGAFAHVRRGIAARLQEAQALLPSGLRLLIIEGYRPADLQAQYFTKYQDSLSALHPEWSDTELRQAASRYVAPLDVAPHCAGAAVDLTLCTKTGEELDMGTRVNASPEESRGRCYTDSTDLSAAAREHRMMFGNALRAVGLVNYPTEWWHWSFGDRYWATVTGVPTACYGPTAPHD